MAVTEAPREQRVVLHNISWDTYERLLEARGDSASPRLTYFEGELQIISPLLGEHEEYSRNLDATVRAVTEALGIDIRDFGSMTMIRDDIKVGVEPDSAFYTISSASVRGKKRPNLNVDPPLDLAIEVDIMHSSLKKLPIYARLGVSEVWLYDGQRLRINVLQEDEYAKSPESSIPSSVTADALTELMEESKTTASTTWMRQLREWAREITPRHRD